MTNEQLLAGFEKTFPEHLWLDVGDDAKMDIEPGDTFHSLHEVTWSEDNASGYGVKYVRSDFAAPKLPSPITAETGNPASAEASAITRESGLASDTAAGAVQLSADLNHGAWLERVALFACMVHQHPDFDDTPSPLADAARAVEAEADQLRTTLEGVAATPPAAAQVPSDARTRFENWACDEFKTVHRKGDDYKERDVHTAWLGWKEALRTPAAPEAGAQVPIEMPPELDPDEIKHILRTTPGPDGYREGLVRAGFKWGMETATALRTAGSDSTDAWQTMTKGDINDL